jgi:hypothetical protein
MEHMVGLDIIYYLVDLNAVLQVDHPRPHLKTLWSVLLGCSFLIGHNVGICGLVLLFVQNKRLLGVLKGSLYPDFQHQIVSKHALDRWRI